MRVRRPNFDFAQTPAVWAKIPEFALNSNANSLWIPHLERFLNRVMAKSLSALKTKDEETDSLRNDVKIFIRQESNHYALHADFNSILSRSGFDMGTLEKQFEAEFERLFSTKSLAFLCAYCEGFETLGPPAALVWLDEIEDLLDGADPQVVSLWKWHLMEEYEHRTVCHDVYHRIHGGYFMRIYGLMYQLKHLMGFSAMARTAMLEQFRAGMSEEQRRESVRREKMVSRRLARALLPRIARACLPFYTPRKSPEPKMFRSHMVQVEAAL